ncbi:MAG: histidinol-phosphatase HisJ family protein [Firmicutes bacterium]|nr:histidinol-phosphatase HisJ family protein [Bacillota bacterium]
MFDYHTHTFFSDDANIPMDEMIEAACKAGITEMAITDHYDPLYPDPDYTFLLDFEAYQKALEKAQATFKDRITIVKGMELGLQSHALEECSRAANAYPYDFIIGSFHCAQGFDLYRRDLLFKDRTVEEVYIGFYTYMKDCLARFEDFNVVGHFNIIDRYSPEIAKDSLTKELREDILRNLAERGKGIEINTSSYRYKMGRRTTPTLDILKTFKKVGGEVITIGSDAHYPEHVGDHHADAVALAKEAGFRYVATFRERKPSFTAV